jgi:hypothetical protein
VPEDSTLLSMLVEDLSQAQASKFLKQYAERTNITYREAEAASFGDNSIHEVYKAYHCGHVRFALHQSMFLKLAADCGLDGSISKCPQNGFPSAVVKIGRFYFTDHYSTSSHEIACLSPSLMRQQNAAVNLSLTQGFLFEPSFDDRKLLVADSIYANFIHGCRGHGNDFSIYGFMRIAIPCAVNPANSEDAQRMLRFVESHNLYKVLAAVVEKEEKPKAVPAIKVATPKLKKLK